MATPQLSKFAVACARFATTVVSGAHGLPSVGVYRATPEGSALAQVGGAVVGFYEKYWPAYPRAQLTIVETPTPLGEAVTFDGLVELSDRIVRSRDPASGQASNLAEFVLAHEIAHQWWGYQVVPSKEPGQLFVLESFAQFSAYKYLEHRRILSAEVAMRSERNRYRRARARIKKGEAPLALLQPDDLPLAYHKGPLVLLSLDKISGGSLMHGFGELIRHYAQSSPAPAQPRAIVDGLVDQLPASRRATARSMLFAAGAQARSAADGAKPDG